MMDGCDGMNAMPRETVSCTVSATESLCVLGVRGKIDHQLGVGVLRSRQMA